MLSSVCLLLNYLKYAPIIRPIWFSKEAARGVNSQSLSLGQTPCDASPQPGGSVLKSNSAELKYSLTLCAAGIKYQAFSLKFELERAIKVFNLEFHFVRGRMQHKQSRWFQTWLKHRAQVS